MTSLTFLGEFPQVALALAFSFACALILAFVCLRIVVRLVTREQYNVTDAPRRVSAIVWNAGDAARAGAINGGSGGETGGRFHSGPYLLPAAATHNRFARNPKSDGARAGRVIQLPGRASGGTAEAGTADNSGGGTSRMVASDDLGKCARLTLRSLADPGRRPDGYHAAVEPPSVH